MIALLHKISFSVCKYFRVAVIFFYLFVFAFLTGTPNVTLLLASNLPPNNYVRNAFRNSMYYEHARNILFVRRERIDSIGEFVVLILHAMSHIKAGEMTDDGNAVFLRQFYKVRLLLKLIVLPPKTRNRYANLSGHGTLDSYVFR